MRLNGRRIATDSRDVQLQERADRADAYLAGGGPYNIKMNDRGLTKVRQPLTKLLPSYEGKAAILS